MTLLAHLVTTTSPIAHLQIRALICYSRLRSIQIPFLQGALGAGRCETDLGRPVVHGAIVYDLCEEDRRA